MRVAVTLLRHSRRPLTPAGTRTLKAIVIRFTIDAVRTPGDVPFDSVAVPQVVVADEEIIFTHMSISADVCRESEPGAGFADRIVSDFRSSVSIHVLDEGSVGVPRAVPVYAVVVRWGEMCQSVADAGVVPPDEGARGARSGAADGGEGGAVLVGSRGVEAATETFEVGPVEFSAEFSCNKNDFITVIADRRALGTVHGVRDII